MNIVAVLDSFKGSLTSIEAGRCVKEGFQRVDPSLNVYVKPLADGGEGTVEAMIEGLQGEKVTIEVTGPLGEKVQSTYGILRKTQMAIIEMSSAAGITLVPRNALNPYLTTTYGVGEMIEDAIKKGCRQFLIGIGGSATNDGGAGMLMALGYRFLDENKRSIALGAQGLQKLAAIDESHVLPELSECTFKIACDVTNPLCGAKGASAVFGPQKGANATMVLEMNQWLKRYAQIVKTIHPESDENAPGSGAAGGLGFAFRSFLGGSLESGIELVMKETHLEEEIKKADLVVTGEGRLDGQSAMGKAPIGVAKLAKKYHKPVIAFAGCVSEDARVCNECGIDAFFPTVRKATSLDEAMDHQNAQNNLKDTAEQVMRLLMMKGV